MKRYRLLTLMIPLTIALATVGCANKAKPDKRCLGKHEVGRGNGGAVRNLAGRLHQTG